MTILFSYSVHDLFKYGEELGVAKYSLGHYISERDPVTNEPTRSMKVSILLYTMRRVSQRGPAVEIDVTYNANGGKNSRVINSISMFVFASSSWALLRFNFNFPDLKAKDCRRTY